MKYIIGLVSAFLLVAITSAQTQTIFELEYTNNGVDVPAFGFTIEKCTDITIQEVWQDWIRAGNGKLAILNKAQASNVTFAGAADTYKINLTLSEEGEDSITVINSISDEFGMYLINTNPDYEIIKESLFDLAFDIRKNCVLKEYIQANEYLIKLNSRLSESQSTLSKTTINIIKNHNEQLKAEKRKNTIAATLASIESALAKNPDAVQHEKLTKQKNKIESEYYSLENKITSLQGKTESDKITGDLEKVKIADFENQISAQQKVVESFRIKLESIYR